MEFVPAAKFFESLAADERVFLLVRHGERRHITPEDPDFGAHVGLTERGREQALSLGKCIPAEGDMSFFSSPVGRCMETALNIGLGRGIQNPLIQKMDCLAEYFVQDYDEYTKVLRAGFYEGICEWLQNEAAGNPRGDKEAFAPLAARSEEMLSMPNNSLLYSTSCLSATEHTLWPQVALLRSRYRATAVVYRRLRII